MKVRLFHVKSYNINIKVVWNARLVSMKIAASSRHGLVVGLSCPLQSWRGYLRLMADTLNDSGAKNICHTE
ncbi:MAG: hypothetical protein A2W93_05655 [Bacteroidetes bacterium GWF2_43_63]|nr:MAG: hypothetical protein A2W93_05655 [Bacteroidetes bacterium GWF2_43_63]HBG69978.1 hypothetical protein [Bacteroidales bacterium]